MDNDRKIEIIRNYERLIPHTAATTSMWFLLPAGVMSGKPITLGEYLKLMIGREELPKGKEGEEMDLKESPRFMCLKNAKLAQGELTTNFDLVRLDLAEVSAWGLHNGK